MVVEDRACFVLSLSVYGFMLCLVCYLFVISTSVIDCHGKIRPRNELLCVEWEVKPYKTQTQLTLNQSIYLSINQSTRDLYRAPLYDTSRSANDSQL